jgi:hypothetical protein
MKGNGDMSDETIPPRGDYSGVPDRQLLERAADNSMWSVQAVGQLTREVSTIKRHVDDQLTLVRRELRRSLTRLTTKTVGISTRLDSLVDDDDEDDDTKTHNLKAAYRSLKRSQTFWLRFTVTTLVLAGLGALGAVLSHFLLGH